MEGGQHRGRGAGEGEEALHDQDPGVQHQVEERRVRPAGAETTPGKVQQLRQVRRGEGEGRLESDGGDDVQGEAGEGGERGGHDRTERRLDVGRNHRHRCQHYQHMTQYGAIQQHKESGSAVKSTK